MWEAKAFKKKKNKSKEFVIQSQSQAAWILNKGKVRFLAGLQLIACVENKALLRLWGQKADVSMLVPGGPGGYTAQQQTHSVVPLSWSKNKYVNKRTKLQD